MRNDFKYQLLALFGLLLISSVGLAAGFSGRWYKVELIVFSHITPQSLSGEVWPNVSPTEFASTNTIELINPGEQAYNSTYGYKALPRSLFALSKEQSELQNQADYHVLLHLAWRQQVFNPGKAKAIHIYGGNVYDSSGKVVANDVYGTLPYNKQNLWQIDGTFKISVRRYFDVNLNLLLSMPATQLSDIANGYYTADQNGMVYFRLLQNRRMRSKELNYIGHPLFGVLIKVTVVNPDWESAGV